MNWDHSAPTFTPNFFPESFHGMGKASHYARTPNPRSREQFPRPKLRDLGSYTIDHLLYFVKCQRCDYGERVSGSYGNQLEDSNDDLWLDVVHGNIESLCYFSPKKDIWTALINLSFMDSSTGLQSWRPYCGGWWTSGRFVLFRSMHCGSRHFGSQKKYSTVERASEASCAKQANEWAPAVRANEQAVRANSLLLIFCRDSKKLYGMTFGKFSIHWWKGC